MRTGGGDFDQRLIFFRIELNFHADGVAALPQHISRRIVIGRTHVDAANFQQLIANLQSYPCGQAVLGHRGDEDAGTPTAIVTTTAICVRNLDAQRLIGSFQIYRPDITGLRNVVVGAAHIARFAYRFSRTGGAFGR